MDKEIIKKLILLLKNTKMNINMKTHMCSDSVIEINKMVYFQEVCLEFHEVWMEMKGFF